MLAANFLEACAGGASEDCCGVVADQFRLSSSAPFATCLCQPSFWQVRLREQCPWRLPLVGAAQATSAFVIYAHG